MGLNPDPTGIDFRGFITAQIVFILSLLKLFLQIFALCVYRGFPGGSDNKESACSAGDPGLIPGLRRSSGEGNGPLHYSCLENPMDKGAWQATVRGESQRVGHD